LNGCVTLSEYAWSIYLSAVAPEERAARLKKWDATNTRTVSKATVNREIACLRKILNKAVEWKVIQVNPLRGIKLFDEREFIRKRYLKPEEVQLLRQSCTPALQKTSSASSSPVGSGSAER
jgi:hypothetical protein